MDDRDSDGADFSGVYDGPSVISTETVRLLTAGAFGIAVGASLSYFFEGGRSGDEAPIRVKGGSTIFELLSKNDVWAEDSGKQHWKPSTGTRANDDYKIVLSVVDPNGICKPTDLHGKIIRVYYDDQHFIQIKSVNKHSKIVPHRDVKPHPSAANILVNPHNIVRIQIDGQIVYFAQDGKLDEMLLLDY